MTKSDLKEMDIVIMRDSKIYWVLYNTQRQGLALMFPNLWMFSMLDAYNEDLTHPDGCKYDIVAVCRFQSCFYAMSAMRKYEKAVVYRTSVKKVIDKWNWNMVRDETVTATDTPSAAVEAEKESERSAK